MAAQNTSHTFWKFNFNSCSYDLSSISFFDKIHRILSKTVQIKTKVFFPCCELHDRVFESPHGQAIFSFFKTSRPALGATLLPIHWVKIKVNPQQAEVTQGVLGRLRPRIFLTFGTTRVVGRQPYAPAAFTSGEIPGTHFQRLSRPQGTWFRREEATEKIPSHTTGNWSRDLPTSSAVP